MTATKGHRGWGHIRKMPSSKRYQASYIGPDCKRHYAARTFAAKMDAESWLNNESRMIDRAIAGGDPWISPAERIAKAAVLGETLSEYGARWIAQRNIKPRTRIHYTSILSDHISPVLGEIAITNLTGAVIRTWYATTLIDRPTFRSHAYQLLHAILGTAVKDSLLQSNPCQIDGASATKRVSQSVILEIHELATVAELIEPQRFKALVLISAWCGLRFGEVTNCSVKISVRVPRSSRLLAA